MAELDKNHPGRHAVPHDRRLPLEPACMRAALDSLPPMAPGVTASQLVGSGAGSSERERALAWVSATFEGMLVPTPASAAIPQMPGHEKPGHGSFLLLNTHVRRQAGFEAQLRRSGLERGGGGVAAFHGTPPHNLFRILCDGLRGDPVYYSSEPSVSAWFVSYRARYAPNHAGVRANNPEICRGWRNSRYKDVAVLLGVEVAGPPPDPQWGEGTAPGHAVLVRHLFLLPEVYVEGSGARGRISTFLLWLFYTSVRGGPVADQMSRDFRGIHDGSLVSEIEDEIRGGQQREIESGASE
ncbi:hypothetical protein PG984_013019 [Apiospora sp. TS-2023a]